MSSRNSPSRVVGRVLVALVSTSLLPTARPCLAQSRCSHTYIGNRPREGNPGWHAEAQGISHDRSHWYLTQNPGRTFFTGSFFFRSTGSPRMWRIPATHDLGKGVSCGSGGVTCVDLEDTELLDFPSVGFPTGYNHFGDITWHDGYVFVPIERIGLPAPVPPAIAVFRGDETLELVDHALLTDPEQRNAGWAAVDADGFLYTSTKKSEDSNFHREFLRYRIDWNELVSEGKLVLELSQVVALRDESGEPLELEHMQGGVFSDQDPRLLYVINGFYEEDCDACGIHVFLVTLAGSDGAPCGSAEGGCVARRVDRSKNGELPFNYQYNPGAVFNAEEPEGITYWDLSALESEVPGETDSGEAVRRSQLHALLLDNDFFTDDVYLKHYAVTCEVPPAREPDLIPERRPGSSGPEGFCRRDGNGLVVRVRNQTNFDVLTQTTTRVLFSPGGTVSQSTPAIPAGSFADVSFVIPAGCFDSDCDFTIMIDAEDQVDESHGDQPDNHETNNVEDGICIG